MARKKSLARDVVRTMMYVVLALLIVVVLRNGYVRAAGYKASKVEKDLCDGNWMVYQETDGFTAPLRCLKTSKDKPLPSWFKPYRVNPDERFILSGMKELCLKRAKPKDVDGILKCVPY